LFLICSILTLAPLCGETEGPAREAGGKVRGKRDQLPKSDLTDRARQLRVDHTRSERRLWSALRNRNLGGWKFKRQVPRGAYIVDFLSAEAGLVVELDGGQHSEQVDYDERRTAWLEADGLRVIRFWNQAIEEDLAAVCDQILGACGGEAPSPSRRPGGRRALPLPTTWGEG